MKFIWHIIAKDLRRHRWALLFWAALYLAQLTLGLVLLGEEIPEKDWILGVQRGNMLLVILQFVMGYFLVTQFVQDDELTGTRMFWATRPISPVRLLAAKALGVLLCFAVGPVLLRLPWWIYNDFTGSVLLQSAVEVFGWQLLLIAPAFLIAALTDDLGRTLLWSLLLVVVVNYLTNFFAWGLRGALDEPLAPLTPEVLFGFWRAGAVLVAGSAALVAHYYLTRRFVRTVGLLVPVFGVLALLALLGQRLRDTALDFGPAPAEFDRVQLAFESAQVRNQYVRTDGTHTSVTERLQLTGLPDDLALHGVVTAQTWRWPETAEVDERSRFVGWGNTQTALLRLFDFPEPTEDPETVKWRQELWEKNVTSQVARGFPPPRLPGARGTLVVGINDLPDALATRIRAVPPAYEAQVQCTLSRPALAFELRMQSDARGAGQSSSLHVQRLNREALVATANVVVTHPGVLQNGLWFSTTMNPWAGISQRPLLAVNRFEQRYSGLGSGFRPVPVTVAGVVISWQTLRVYARTIARNGKWVAADRDWAEHTTLALVPFQPVARFTREIRADKFELQPSDEELIKAGAPAGKVAALR